MNQILVLVIGSFHKGYCVPHGILSGIELIITLGNRIFLEKPLPAGRSLILKCVSKKMAYVTPFHVVAEKITQFDSIYLPLFLVIFFVIFFGLF